MVSDYIEREAVLRRYQKCSFAMVKAVIAYIKDIPAADVASVRHGQWKYKLTTGDGFEIVECTECGEEAFAMAYFVREGEYCPHCGAKMDGGDDNGKAD